MKNTGIENDEQYARTAMWRLRFQQDADVLKERAETDWIAALQRDSLLSMAETLKVQLDDYDRRRGKGAHGQGR